MELFESTLPMGYAADPDEIGRFVKSIVDQEINYLSGVTINFDGALSCLFNLWLVTVNTDQLTG